MTLVLAVNGPESAWVVADRRLSYVGRPPKDDGRKLMFLETTDASQSWATPGSGRLLAGLEPADWIASVLRGRNLPLERSLGVPIGERVENRYAPAPQTGSWDTSYFRLKQYVEALPKSAEEILAYLKSVEIFTHITSKARDLEYVLQQRFVALAASQDPRAALCYQMSFRGSRRIDPGFVVGGHTLPEGVTIAGLSDPD